MTIETHYESLRTAALSVYTHSTAYTLRLVAACRLVAAQRWPIERARLAAAGEPMPKGPPRFSDSGCTLSFGVCTEHDQIAYARTILAAVVKDLAPALERERLDRIAAWETYRRAVEQGVAIAP